MPPSVLAMMSGRRSGAVQQHGEIKFLFDFRRAGDEQRLLTRRPSGPVCLVTSTLPSMALAFSKTSSAASAKFDAALETALESSLAASAGMDLGFDDDHVSPLAKSFSAIFLAASALSQTSPAGTATPYWASNCLAWNS